MVVFGGSGFVGAHVCRNLVRSGKKIAAVNRSGSPKLKEVWMDHVSYISGRSRQSFLRCLTYYAHEYVLFPVLQGMSLHLTPGEAF